MPRVPGVGSNGDRGQGNMNEDEDDENYSRYAAKQVATLYQGCTMPKHTKRQGMINKYFALATISNQIKIWFQNRSYDGGEGHMNKDEDGGKYSRYTEEQVATLEYMYHGCTEHKHSERQGMIIHTYFVLPTMDSNHIKLWFQNRRTRDKRKIMSIDLQEVNKQLRVSILSCGTYMSLKGISVTYDRLVVLTVEEGAQELQEASHLDSA